MPDLVNYLLSLAWITLPRKRNLTKLTTVNLLYFCAVCGWNKNGFTVRLCMVCICMSLHCSVIWLFTFTAFVRCTFLISCSYRYVVPTNMPFSNCARTKEQSWHSLLCKSIIIEIIPQLPRLSVRLVDKSYVSGSIRHCKSSCLLEF